ncbi:hypothetical protein GWI33_022708, partial [Rhynchophorus ferrugineus]
FFEKYCPLCIKNRINPEKYYPYPLTAPCRATERSSSSFPTSPTASPTPSPSAERYERKKSSGRDIKELSPAATRKNQRDRKGYRKESGSDGLGVESVTSQAKNAISLSCCLEGEAYAVLLRLHLLLAVQRFKCFVNVPVHGKKRPGTVVKVGSVVGQDKKQEDLNVQRTGTFPPFRGHGKVPVRKGTLSHEGPLRNRTIRTPYQHMACLMGMRGNAKESAEDR